jgi:hypothetical protein
VLIQIKPSLVAGEHALSSHRSVPRGSRSIRNGSANKLPLNRFGLIIHLKRFASGATETAAPASVALDLDQRAVP